jgi:hypothetical protein
MKHYTEFELQQALADVAAGCPIRQAAREWGIPYQSLQHRLKGRQSRNAAWVDYQRLSQSQEANLAAYISTQEALGMPLTHQQVKGLAERMMGDTHRPLGRKRIGRFLRRNPSIRAKRSRAIDARRWRSHSSEVIHEFFHRLDSIPAIQGIHPSNRWNMDKTGIIKLRNRSTNRFDRFD